MNRTFDFYEYAGIIVPGAVFILGAIWLFPESHTLFNKEGITLGVFGLFVIVAYATGQLIQGVGNWIEWLWWKMWGGFPSKRILAGHFISTDQHKRLVEALHLDGKVTGEVTTRSPPEHLAIVPEVYSVVAAAGKATRIDKFNGNYGLLRGVAASFLTLFIAAAIVAKDIYVIVGLAALFFLALQRMHRFGKHYALELFIQYLVISKRSPGAR